jgi:hypothetical protein
MKKQEEIESKSKIFVFLNSHGYPFRNIIDSQLKYFSPLYFPVNASGYLII